jgi:hypothetical protein
MKAEWITSLLAEADDTTQREKKKKKKKASAPRRRMRPDAAIRASSLSLAGKTSMRRVRSMRTSIARAARWRIATRNASSISSPIEPPAGPCAPISCACGSRSYVLMSALRRLCPSGAKLANATCGTICLKLLKIGAQVKISARRVLFSMASAFPYVDEFTAACAAVT